MIHYRALFSELLGEPAAGQDAKTAGGPVTTTQPDGLPAVDPAPAAAQAGGAAAQADGAAARGDGVVAQPAASVQPAASAEPAGPACQTSPASPPATRPVIRPRTR